MGSASMASPDFVVTFTFFLLLLYLAFHSSEATHPECKLSTIYCENEKHIIKSQLGKYEIKSVSEDNNSILVHDIQLSERLRWDDCSGLFNLQDPIFPTFFKFKTPNHTFLKCNKLYTPPPPGLDSPDIHRYPHCKDCDLFYSNKSEHGLPPEDQLASFGCSKFDYPVLPPVDGNWDLLVPVLESGFFLELNYPSECHDDCQVTCRREWNGALNKCAGGKKLLGKFLAIGFAGFAGGILLPFLIFFFYRRRRRNGRFFGSAITKNLSSSLTPLSGNTLDPGRGGSTYFRVPIFSYEELVDATNNFDSSKELGDGGFGIVYYGKLRDGREVAIKRLYENTFKRVEQFMNEVEILNRLRHQNLVTLYGCTSRHSRELLLVYEYIPNGTVADHLHGEIANAVSLRWPTRLSIAIETASALAYLHASDIIHRDVKTNNILLDNNFRVKVADFGLSRLFPLDVTHVSTTPQGTPGYVDPEYRRCYQLTEKSDVYSFGVVLIELISSLPAVDINRHRQEINLANLAMNKIQSGALHELIDPCLGFEADYGVRMMTTLVAELAFRCLQLDREMRPSMDEVLEVLKGIESEDYKMEKEEVVGIPAEEVGMLKSIQPPISQA